MLNSDKLTVHFAKKKRQMIEEKKKKKSVFFFFFLQELLFAEDQTRWIFDCFCHFAFTTYIVRAHKNCVKEELLKSTHSIAFKIYVKYYHFFFIFNTHM